MFEKKSKYFIKLDLSTLNIIWIGMKVGEKMIVLFVGPVMNSVIIVHSIHFCRTGNYAFYGIMLIRGIMIM